MLLSLARLVLTVTETAERKISPKSEAPLLLRSEAVSPRRTLAHAAEEQQDMQVLPSGSLAAVAVGDVLQRKPHHHKGRTSKTFSSNWRAQQAMSYVRNESHPDMLPLVGAEMVSRTKTGEDPADADLQWWDAGYLASHSPESSSAETWKKYIPNQSDPHNLQQYNKSVDEKTQMIVPSGIMEQVADGVGPAAYSRSPASNNELKFELRKRLVAQDKATILILLFVLIVAIFVSCLGVYQFSNDPSQVAFYTDPKFNRQRLLCCQSDTSSFLEAFNSPPEVASLRVIGKRVSPADQLRNGRARIQPPVPEDQEFEDPPLAALGHLGRQLLLPGRRASQTDGSIIFDFSLDLSSFISGQGSLASDAEEQKLCQHLASDNPLQIAVLRKKVTWSNWGDVATNIRQKLRSGGFSGDLEIRFDSEEEMRIYRNHRFQNFVRAPVTHVLAVLSGVGPLFWYPYLYFRTSIVHIETQFKIEVDLSRYWDMIAVGLSPEHGFSTPNLM